MRLKLMAASALMAAAFAMPALAGDLTPKAAGEVLAALDQKLNGYVDPEKAARVRAALKANRARYLHLDSREAFVEAVSKDTVEASGDLHLKLSIRTTDASAQARETPEEEALLEARLAHGLMQVRRLPGNIGYLKLRYFALDEAGATMIDAAMLLLKDTDVLIIDLRENTGGGGQSDERLLGHLSRTAIPMAEIHWRKEDGSIEKETRRPTIGAGGPLYPDRPVYVLTSKRTFSAAEGFAYDLKASGRALLIGENTRGGGNPANRDNLLPYGMAVFIPNGKVVHPLTGKSWEGVGIAPDVATPKDGALTEAYARALAVANPLVSTPKSEAELAAARADPRGALIGDQML
jgi:C-terminal processing protease CtpA/Prc